MTITESVPTDYAGIRFRSRLEARWAVFLATAGIEWRYEPRTLAIHVPRRHRLIPWLPDFWLPHSAQLAEVKGFMYADGFRRIRDIAHGTKYDVVILGHIPGPFDTRWPIQLHNYKGEYAPHGLYALPWSPGVSLLTRAIRERDFTPELLVKGYPTVPPEWSEEPLEAARRYRFPRTSGPVDLR